MWKWILSSVVAFSLLAAVFFGLRQAQQSPQPKPEKTFTSKGKPIDAPGPLGELYREQPLIVDDSQQRFQKTLKKLVGKPVVINKWASWCGPCRLELPFFRQVALEKGTEIAFLGINSNDNRDNANSFIKQEQLPFPSFEDPDSEIAKRFHADRSFPTTVFIDRQGKTFVHQGGYADMKTLERDIQLYSTKDKK